jgi:hypothetical protein
MARGSDIRIGRVVDVRGAEESSVFAIRDPAASEARARSGGEARRLGLVTRLSSGRIISGDFAQRMAMKRGILQEMERRFD